MAYTERVVFNWEIKSRVYQPGKERVTPYPKVLLEATISDYMYLHHRSFNFLVLILFPHIVHMLLYTLPSRRGMYCTRVCRITSFKSSLRLFSSSEPSTLPPVSPSEKRVKRKIAFVAGYVGSNYYGLQMDPNCATLPTIERTLQSALHQAGFIADSNAKDLTKIGIFWALSYFDIPNFIKSHDLQAGLEAVERTKGSTRQG